MKSVLISIQPKWCELIASGEKTVEVRKTAPKLETPFKCYIYCTKAKEKLFNVMKDGDENYGGTYHGKPIFIKLEDGNCNDMYFRRQKVIGEFVCDEITVLNYDTDWGVEPPQEGYFLVEPYSEYVLFDFNPCLTNKEMIDYSRGKPLYGWHISKLKIYDKPKELGEFYSYKEVVAGTCKDKNCVKTDLECYECLGVKSLTRPPQSYCYVEEL